ncbi:MAG: EAL domain-containing protein [Thiothrix sp.]|nr:EAL domain-containing protein [Thiothrix sp.]
MEALTAEQLPVDRTFPPPDRIKILIIDDEVPLLKFLEGILVNAGYTVIAEKNPVNAVNLAICMQPDIIVLDVVMPELDGFTICRQLKQNPLFKNIPIIFLTICDQIDDKIQGLESGGVDYLIKPLDSREVLARIRRHIEISRVRQSLEQTIQEKENQLVSLKSKLDKASNFIIHFDSPYQKILSTLEIGIIKIDKNFTCLVANTAAAHLLGYADPQEMVGRTMLRRKKNENKRQSDLLSATGKLRKIIATRRISLLTRDDRQLPVELDLTPINDENPGETAVISFNDISVEKSMLPGIVSPGYQDPLTGLENRTAFQEILKHENRLSGSAAHTPAAIFIVDLDYFKEVNDSFGHLAGDQVLCEIATRLGGAIREHDQVTRLGGDEFGLLIRNFNSLDDLEQLAKRLIDRIRTPIQLPNATVNLSACIGIAILDRYMPHIDDIINRADMALYKAKEQRQQGYCLFQKEMLDELEDELLLAKELPELLENNQLYVEYQPQFAVNDSSYIGAEALVRWNHPSKGRLLPVSFLPIAEKRGFLRNISNHSLKKICEQIHEWKTQNIQFGKISANICAAQLNDSNFFDEITSLFEQYEIDPNDLVFELTENTLFSTNAQTKKKLSKLIQLGVRFAIDDFGVGFSSMQLLKDLHSDIMKIDKSFIAEIESSEKSRTIIKSIIDLSKNLKMYVVAEGVENRNQLIFLKDCGCDSFQGFYQSQSVDAKTLEQHFPRA